MFKSQRLAILAEGSFGILTSKTAACIIRYQPERVACVIDGTKQGGCAQDILGFGGDIPIVGSLKEALALSPDSLLIGIAPRGGALPEEWRPIVLDAIKSGLNVVSGLHTFLAEDPEIGTAARNRGVEIWDVRKTVMPREVSKGLLRNKKGLVVLTVGSDSRTGKMTVAYELVSFLKRKGVDAAFVPTGQTGILLAGWGSAVDRVPGDFMSRVIEDLTVRALETARVAVVEGQGSLIHPAYSGVTLAILHGCCPDAMILCHDASRKEIEGYGLKIPALDDMARLYEQAAAPVSPSRVIAVSLNTYGMSEAEAQAASKLAEETTGVPATDAVRWGCEKLYGPLEELL